MLEEVAEKIESVCLRELKSGLFFIISLRELFHWKLILVLEKHTLGIYILIIFYYNCLFLCFWLHWIFVAAHGLSQLVAAELSSSCGGQASHCRGFSRCRAQALGTQASAVTALGLSSRGLRAVVALGHKDSSQTRD